MSGPLGNNTKSSSLEEGSETRKTLTSQEFRHEKYRLQNVIRKLVIAESDFNPQEPDFDVYNSLPRVVKCRRCRVAPTVGIKLDPALERAHFSGLTACGSVWTCPICASQIQEVRRGEISQGIAWAYGEGKKVVMATMTIPHYEFQTCADVLEGFTGALKYLRSGVRYQKFKNEIGFEGMIRSLETLYGNNGWHTHSHELLIVDRDADAQEIQKFLLTRWEQACHKFGLIPRGKMRDFRKHSVHVLDNAHDSDYLAKSADIDHVCWGADREITKAFTKSSRWSLHPFQLADLAGTGDKKAAAAFIEYAEAFKGRAAIFWTPGLKKRVNIFEEITDQEAAELEPEQVETVSEIDSLAWAEVLAQGARAKLLEIAEQFGSEGVESWLRANGLNSVSSSYLYHLKQIRSAKNHTTVLDQQCDQDGYRWYSQNRQ